MDTSKYKVIITPTASREMTRIYEYIREDLDAENAAINLMKQVETEFDRLQRSPYIYAEIEQYDDLKRKYRRIVVKNYVLLYTIDELEHVVFVSHMYYGRRNYIKFRNF